MQIKIIPENNLYLSGAYSRAYEKNQFLNKRFQTARRAAYVPTPLPLHMYIYGYITYLGTIDQSIIRLYRLPIEIYCDIRVLCKLMDCIYNSFGT